jgi:hypothetical protein
MILSVAFFAFLFLPFNPVQEDGGYRWAIDMTNAVLTSLVLLAYV